MGSRSRLRWFAPQDGSRWSTPCVSPQGPARTPPLRPLNSQVLLQPLFPSQTPSIRCGLEESCIHPRAPRLLTRPHASAAGASPPPSPGAALSLSAGCSAHRSDPQGSAGIVRGLPERIHTRRGPFLERDNKISRTPRKHSVILAPGGRDALSSLKQILKGIQG